MPTQAVSSIVENVAAIRERIEGAAMRAGRGTRRVTLMAVTKGVAAAAIREAFGVGVRCFGENYLQEARQKLEGLEDIRALAEWHMIGSLQHGRVPAALQVFDVLQGVPSVRIAEAISRRAQAPYPVFLEVNVATEPTKHGLLSEEAPRAIEDVRRLPNVDLRGLMTIAPASTDPEAARPVFRRLRQIAAAAGLRELSMGMSGDFEVAVEEGATIVRIGSGIFGPRGPAGPASDRGKGKDQA
jgi:pyridoxal phosphate enzyme (YggS family)